MLCFSNPDKYAKKSPTIHSPAGEAVKGEGEEKGRKTEESVFQERKAGNIT